jgi:magnesium transporter
MSKHKNKRGFAPGSVVFTGNRKVEHVLIHHLQYDANEFTEQVIDSASKSSLKKHITEKVDWYDIRGMHDTELIVFLGNTFDIHPLVQASIVDINQRPKFEEYSKGLFIVKKEHVAIYFNDGLIASFQETESDLFQFVRKRIQTDKSRIRTRRADYLAYALIDETVDNYYVVLEEIENQIEQLEDKMLVELNDLSKNDIHRLKIELSLSETYMKIQFRLWILLIPAGTC